MNHQLIDVTKKVKTIANELDFNWEELLSLATSTKDSISDEEYASMLSISLLINSLETAGIPKEEFNKIFDIWESCYAFEEQTKAVHIAFATSLHLRLEKQISKQDLKNFLSRSENDLKEEIKKEFSKISDATAYFAKFYYLLKDLKTRGFADNDLHTAKIIWVACNSNKVELPKCANIALYWLRNKFSQY